MTEGGIIVIPEEGPVTNAVVMPKRAVNLIRRLHKLPPGRYQLIVTLGGARWDWSILPLGQVEESK